MTKNEFKKYRTKIIVINLLFFVVIFGLTISALYSKTLNNILFSDNFLPQNLQYFLDMYFQRYFSHDSFLLGYISAFGIVLLIPINFIYFEERNKYYISENIIIKENKNFKKIAFYLFLATTIINIFFFLFVLEEVFLKKYGFNFSDNTVIYSFLALIPNIMLVLAAKIL